MKLGYEPYAYHQAVFGDTFGDGLNVVCDHILVADGSLRIGGVGDTFYDELNAFVCVLLGEPLLGGSLRQRSSWKES